MVTKLKKEKTTVKKEKAVTKTVKIKAVVKPKKAAVIKADKAHKAAALVKVKPAAKVKEKISPVVNRAIVPPAAEAVKIKPAIEIKSAVEIKPKLSEIKPKPAGVMKPPVEIKPKPVEAKPKPIELKPSEVKPVIEVKPAATVELKELELDLPITVKDLAIKLQEKPSVIIKTLMGMRVIAGINQDLKDDVVTKLCQDHGFKIKEAPDEEETALSVHHEADAAEFIKPRSPIVTFMGHVDHGKTSLLDAIRKTKVAESEHGGITQHIGAYRVNLEHGHITFLDTPGHEAFTAMRSRGARITDAVVLVVAADDGIMPQTQEAIDHARAAGVPIIVALNKVDKPQANIDKVKKQLAELNLTPEDWGGKTITVPVSAKTGQGIDDLLEMILLEAQMLELKANPQRPASGVVIEAKITKGRGPVTTLLVQNGTLHLNDNIIVGQYYGKVRAMFDDHGRSVTDAGPSMPVEILGVTAPPQAGEQFFVIQDEKTAKDLALRRQEKEKQEKIKTIKRASLEDLSAQIKEGKLKELKLIIKADVQGSLEAIRQTLGKLNASEVALNIIHEGTGDINTSDVILAVASNALILGFNIIADERGKELASQEGQDIRIYNIIYELANDIKAALEGMLEPKLKKVFLGRVEIRKVFKLSRSGSVAGCFVVKGKINRSCSLALVRNGQVVFEGKVSSLKRFKDDVREVLEGFECGITLAGFDDIKEGDIIEAYDIEKIARKL